MKIILTLLLFVSLYADVKKDMLKGLSSPIHKGALRYYREAGLDKYINPKLIID